MTVKLLTKPYLRFLSLKGGGTGWSEFTLAKYHIVGNHMSRLLYELRTSPTVLDFELKKVLLPSP